MVSQMVPHRCRRQPPPSHSLGVVNDDTHVDSFSCTMFLNRLNIALQIIRLIYGLAKLLQTFLLKIPEVQGTR